MIKNIYDKKEIQNKINEYKKNKVFYSLDKLNELNKMPVETWQYETKTTITKIDFNELGLFIRKWQKIGKNAEITKKEIYLR